MCTMKNSTIIAPSLLSADFGQLAQQLDMINRSAAEWLHLDVMDGVFVPNISFGFPVIKAAQRLCSKVLDVHMMTVHPENYIDAVRQAGGQVMTVHAEACTHLHRTIQQIHAAGMKAGVALNPATPLCAVEEVLEDADLILIMSVNPGFGGQSFIPQAISKIKRLRLMVDATTKKPLIEVDGGINGQTAPQVIEAGANVLVSGSYVFGAANPCQTIRGLLGHE